MVKIKPLSYKDLFHVFGDPGTKKGKEQIKSQLISIDIPFPLNQGKTNKIYCNKYIAESIVDIYKEMWDYYGYETIKEKGYDEYGGCYNHRQTRNRKWWSVHSWGTAIDILMKYGGYGKKPITPIEIVKMFTKRGFYWGGYWKYPDGMHFSVCNG